MRLRVACLKLEHQILIRVVQDTKAALRTDFGEEPIINRTKALLHQMVHAKAERLEQESAHRDAIIRNAPENLMVVVAFDRTLIVDDTPAHRAVKMFVCEPHHRAGRYSQYPRLSVDVAQK